MMQEIEQDKINTEKAQQDKLKTDSDARRITAQAVISTLDLSIDDKLSYSEQKVKAYENMEYLKDEIKKATYSELKDELQKRIDQELILANQLKDLQRSQKTTHNPPKPIIETARAVEPLRESSKPKKKWWQFWK